MTCLRPGGRERQWSCAECVVQVGEHGPASLAEDLTCKDLLGEEGDLLGSVGPDEAGQDDDVGDVALAGGPDLHGKEVAGRRGEHGQPRQGENGRGPSSAIVGR